MSAEVLHIEVTADDTGRGEGELQEVILHAEETGRPRPRDGNVDEQDAARMAELKRVVDAVYDGTADDESTYAPANPYLSEPRHDEVTDVARKANVEAARALIGQALGFESQQRADDAVAEADERTAELGDGGDAFMWVTQSEQRRGQGDVARL